jgi:hypothetical protein
VLAWRWDAALPNNQIWIGSDRAGLKLHLKGSGLVDGEDAWDSPLFKFTEDQIPPSWGNEGKGGCNLTAMPTATDSTSPPGALLSPFSGPLTLPAAHAPPLTFTFDMSVTPFKTPNQTQHWGLRHFQVFACKQGRWLCACVAVVCSLLRVCLLAVAVVAVWYAQAH